MTTTRVGFVGGGFIANRHMNDLLGFSDVCVVAVADPIAERAAGLAARCSGRSYGATAEMLDSEDLDAVYICVPPYAHGAPEFAALERGLPFFVEKPIATDLAVAEAIDRRVAARELTTATGYHWRYLDTTERVLDLLSSRLARLALGYWLDFTPPPAWWVLESQSGGQVVEQATHIFDLARLLVGEVSHVYGAAQRLERKTFPDADVADVSTTTLHFHSGALGNLSSTCLLDWPHRIGLHLFCEGMVIELSEHEMMVDVGHGRPVQLAQGDPFVREDRDFIDAVQGKANRIRAPYSEALKTHRLAVAAARSGREGRVLEVEPRWSR